MVTRGWWNVHTNGTWYQIHNNIGRISSPGDSQTYFILKKLQDGIQKAHHAILIPFPLPLGRGFSYVYTLDLDAMHLTVSFWHSEERAQRSALVRSTLVLAMRRLSLALIREPSDLLMAELLEHGVDPLLNLANGANRYELSANGVKSECLTTKMNQPTQMGELQHRMFTDFIFHWRFFIDEEPIWHSYSPLLFRRLCIGILRLATWDFEISSDGELVTLPLGAETFPDWQCPAEPVYWFHGYLVVLCDDLDAKSGIADCVSQAREFLVASNVTGKFVNCIFLSLFEICILQISTDTEKVSATSTLPLITNISASKPSPGFRLLSQILTANALITDQVTTPDHGDSKFDSSIAASETSLLSLLPAEILGAVLSYVTPRDIVSFARASCLVRKWYYLSLPQLPVVNIHEFNVSIPCCGVRRKGQDSVGFCCSTCYTWTHSRCIASANNKSRLPKDESTSQQSCAECHNISTTLTQQRTPKTYARLSLGALGVAGRQNTRPGGCPIVLTHSLHNGRHLHQEIQERKKNGRIFQLRTSAPAIKRPELRRMDYDLSRTPPNQIDYAVLFGGVWSGLSYGLDPIV